MATRRLLISFLGTGDYTPTYYTFPGSPRPERPTAFVQHAIIEHFHQQMQPFTHVHMLLTSESKAGNWVELHDELRGAELLNELVLTSDDSIASDQQDTDSHWGWFRQILEVVNRDDEVVFDFTHGFRSVPIALSAALALLQRTKPFVLRGAYYGFTPRLKPPQSPCEGSMIDMAPFYEVNHWAEAVGSLVDSANADPLAALAKSSTSPLFPGLRDPKLQHSLTTLTAAVKDVDVQRVAERASDAIGRVHDAKDASTNAAERLLLDLVLDKFADLARHVGRGGYNLPYFQTQLILTDKLIEHGMHMQAFTVMSEMVISLGLLSHPQHSAKNRTSRVSVDKRMCYGRVFLQYVSRAPDEFDRELFVEAVVDRIEAKWGAEPYRSALGLLRIIAPTVSTFRNGFNHAWTSRQPIPADIHEQAAQCLVALKDALQILERGHIFANR